VVFVPQHCPHGSVQADPRRLRQTEAAFHQKSSWPAVIMSIDMSCASIHRFICANPLGQRASSLDSASC